MSEVVYLLGAGFNCSVIDQSRGKPAPLARNFFQVLIEHGDFEQKLPGIRRTVYVDLLLDEIKRFWRLDLEALRSQPFDVEECLTLFESQLADTKDRERTIVLLRASFALRSLLLMYLGDLRFGGYTPTARRFGQEVLASSADVLTFNYDALAEDAIELASGIGSKPMPESLRGGATLDGSAIPDEDLDASHNAWRRGLAYGIRFGELALPVAGVPHYIEGSRYYAHPANQLYATTRVLKLHGSIDWLRYTDQRIYPPYEEESLPAPEGLVLGQHESYWMAEPPHRGPWRMEPIIVPPNLYKDFKNEPLPLVWEAALEALSECETLIVVGYSFPPTDFRTRRLFLEAFRDHKLRQLAVVNPDQSVVGIVRHLTHFDGPAVTCDSLSAYYGEPQSWFDR